MSGTSCFCRKKNRLSNAYKSSVLIVILGWFAVFTAVTFLRPLMPMDETRYLTVAWEMLQRDSWILPTLNYEPYSHKPPLTFWLIRAAWEVFGVGTQAARIVIFMAVAALLALTGNLARRLYGSRETAVAAVLLMSALPGYLVYGSVIMFDSLLAVFVAMSMIAIWAAGREDRLKYRVLLGVAMGLGILCKGPVALVYILPTALLAPLWLRDRAVSWRQWYAGLFMAFSIAAAIALSWAIPAALQGGPYYAYKIFYGQSAGRMVDAFDHVEPFWFYAPVLTAFLLPLLSWSAFWRSARSLKLTPQTRFLLCWFAPAMIFFTCISSKSIHYVIPFLPGIVILAASFVQVHSGKSLRLPLFLMALPSAVLMSVGVFHITIEGKFLEDPNPVLGAAHLALAAGIYFWARSRPQHAFRTMATSAFLSVVMIHALLAESFLPRYDLRPLAKEARKYEHRPWAAAPKYDGEFGFVLRTQKTLPSIGREDVEWWLQHTRDGIVIGRYKPYALPRPELYRILYQQPFRTDEVIVILEAIDRSLLHYRK